MFEQAVELINEHRISLLVLAARWGMINTEVDSLLVIDRETRVSSKEEWLKGKEVVKEMQELYQLWKMMVSPPLGGSGKRPDAVAGRGQVRASGVVPSRPQPGLSEKHQLAVCCW